MAQAAPWIATAAGAALDAYGNKRAGDKAASQSNRLFDFYQSYEGSPDQARARNALAFNATGQWAPMGADFYGGDLANMAQSRYREMLSPDYVNNLTSGGIAQGALDRYRTATQPGFLTDLNDALNETRARIGGQYGVRFGGDLTDMLGEQTRRAVIDREGVMANQFNNMWGNALAGAGMAQSVPLSVEQWLSSRRSPLMTLATSGVNAPGMGTTNYQPGTGLAGSLGSSMGNFPMMWYLYGKGA